MYIIHLCARPNYYKIAIGCLKPIMVLNLHWQVKKWSMTTSSVIVESRKGLAAELARSWNLPNPAYLTSWHYRLLGLIWELCNTRYRVGETCQLHLLNQHQHPCCWFQVRINWLKGRIRPTSYVGGLAERGGEGWWSHMRLRNRCACEIEHERDTVAQT